MTHKYNNSGQLYKQVAIALGYDPNKDSAPKILATGKGNIAEKIMDLARVHDIPIHQDEDLAEVLSTLEINQLIPIEVYSAVADILSLIYKFDKDSSTQNLKKSIKNA